MVLSLTGTIISHNGADEQVQKYLKLGTFVPIVEREVLDFTGRIGYDITDCDILYRPRAEGDSNDSD